MGRESDRDRSTIRDVAAAAGVSIATVSRVLNGRPDVAQATREAVLRAVRELGFTSNRSARSLSGGRTSLVAVTLPLLDAEYFARILAGTADALYEQDMQVVLAPTLHLRDRAVESLARLANGVTDGAVLILPEESKHELTALGRAGYPFVVIDPIESRSTKACQQSRPQTPLAAAPRPSTCFLWGIGALASSPVSPIGWPASSV
jgi:LacI family transcriptional regulator